MADTPEKKTEEVKKNFFQKMISNIDDKEEQIDLLSAIVRLVILIWSGGILTLAYVNLPSSLGIPEQKLDPTFIASVFTGTLATFGVQAARGVKSNTTGISKGDLEALIKKAAEIKPHQTITIEHNPITLKTSEDKYEL